MTEQPTEDAPQGENTPASENTPQGENTPASENTPQGENTPASENTPQGENSPPSEFCPPISEITPPSGDTPASGDSPLSEHTPPTISAPLRADLCKAWVLGFLDAMKGEAVNDDDEIESDMAELLVEMAEGCIDSSTELIAQVFVENPQTVYQTIYSMGFEVSSTMNLKAAAELNRN